MAVPTDIGDLSTTAASNSPAGSDAIGTSLDDYLRAIQAIVKQDASVGANIASSGTITVPDAGHYFVVTGTTQISTINDSWDGRIVALKFSGALTIVNSAGIVMPGEANYATENGDVLIFVNESTGVWRLMNIMGSAGEQQRDLTPSTDDTYNLGTASKQWKDLYVDGTANIDSLVADTADVNGGTIDGTAIGSATPSTGAFSTISTTGDITPAAGKGIDFSAESGSADTNVLDFYKEGTFTPVLTAATPGDISVAYNVQLGRYTRIGNRVMFTVNIDPSTFTHTTASGNLRITGLPYTSKNVSGLDHIIVCNIEEWNNPGSETWVNGFIPANTQYVQFRRMANDGSGWGNVAVTEIASGSSPRIELTGTYEV